MLRHISLIALTPQQFEVYVAYERRVSDQCETICKNMSLKVIAFIAPKWRGELTWKESGTERPVPSRHSSHLRKTGALLDTSDRYLAFRKGITAGW